jgi:hypothetical protein
MEKHNLCQDPNLLSLIANKIDYVFNFYKVITCSLSTKTMVKFMHIDCKRQVGEP